MRGGNCIHIRWTPCVLRPSEAVFPLPSIFYRGRRCRRKSGRIAKENFMGPDGSEYNSFFFEMKGKSVFHGDRTFPPVLNSLDYLNPDRWMAHVGKKRGSFSLNAFRISIGRARYCFLNLWLKRYPFICPTISTLLQQFEIPVIFVRLRPHHQLRLLFFATLLSSTNFGLDL